MLSFFILLSRKQIVCVQEVCSLIFVAWVFKLQNNLCNLGQLLSINNRHLAAVLPFNWPNISNGETFFNKFFSSVQNFGKNCSLRPTSGVLVQCASFSVCSIKFFSWLLIGHRDSRDQNAELWLAGSGPDPIYIVLQQQSFPRNLNWCENTKEICPTTLEFNEPSISTRFASECPTKDWGSCL